ncbi:flagellar transcriptional regulator FlhD [uncultured Salinisphaera sp.]|jgi:flagellar transcriptional activator FlhD|uniref:flagellar transcriptional regulator FlhD n=1 Tax=uncultured Salinisphaera sp. TaxID=359372 RepID=UPI0032B15013
MSVDHLLDDVRDLNLSYLILMQRLINTDRELAMFRLKIDEDMADLLSQIPVADLAKLARCNQLLCHFSLDSAEQLFALVNAPRDDDMRRLHAGILLSSQNKRKSDRRGGERREGGDRRDSVAAESGDVPARRKQPRREADREAERKSGSGEG